MSSIKGTVLSSSSRYFQSVYAN